jgi:hypothetical protein
MCPPTTPWVSFIGTRRARGAEGDTRAAAVRAINTNRARARAVDNRKTERCVDLDCSFAMGGWLARHIFVPCTRHTPMHSGKLRRFFSPFWNILLQDAVLAIIAIENKNIAILFELKKVIQEQLKYANQVSHTC